MLPARFPGYAQLAPQALNSKIPKTIIFCILMQAQGSNIKIIEHLQHFRIPVQGQRLQFRNKP